LEPNGNSGEKFFEFLGVGEGYGGPLRLDQTFASEVGQEASDGFAGTANQRTNLLVGQL
jgi:hypothetical protein